MGVKKHTISQQRNKCIGCGSCVFLAPKNWRMNDDDGRADLIGGELRKNNVVVATIDEADLEANKNAAEACPVNIIKLH